MGPCNCRSLYIELEAFDENAHLHEVTGRLGEQLAAAQAAKKRRLNSRRGVKHVSHPLGRPKPAVQHTTALLAHDATVQQSLQEAIEQAGDEGGSD